MLSHQQRWRLVRTLLVLAAMLVATTGLAALVSSADAPIALADVSHDKDDDDGGDNEDKNLGNDDDEDHVAQGQVLEINTLKDPPEMQVAGFDGVMLVILLKKDEIERNGVHLGDHVRLLGEKIHELRFEATQIEVTNRCCGPPDNDNNEEQDEDD
jgi:hypothetical protein